MNENCSSKLSKNQRHRINKQEKEHRYQQLYPPYHPIHNYDIYFINKYTTLHEIEYLISIAQQTKDFSFDTESDYCKLQINQH